MRNVEVFLATTGLIICLLLLGRMLLSASARQRLDAAGQHAWQRLRHTFERLWRNARQRRPARPADHRSAAEVAEQAIRRAKGDPRSEVTREGNLYKPKSFKGPRKPH